METLSNDTIYDYIKSQEALYRLPISINDRWDWGMQKHIKLTELYKNSQLWEGKGDYTPVMNIIRPILNLQYRSEDIDVKDVQLYVDDPKKYHLSFLVKKYHDDVFVVENDLDTFFDELNESRIDFGGGLSKKLNKPCPEVVPLQSIAFCDQTDILSGPIGIKHFYSPDQLLAMANKGWGNKANGATNTLEETILLSREEKKDQKDGIITKTPGRYIEVYEIHGNLPKRFAYINDTSGKYETRLFIVCFYTPKDSKEKSGIILYTALEIESPFKLIKRDPVFGRALGFGGGEELFEPQVWVNYDMIRMQDMLDSASKTILKGSAAIAQKHPAGLKNLDNLEMLEVDFAAGEDVGQVETYPRNIAIFEKSVDKWTEHARTMGAAQEAIMGEAPTSGTPFKSVEFQATESHSLHDFRRGKFAKHLEEIYKEWIIPHIEKEIVKGAEFLSELSIEEMQYVTDCVVQNRANKMVGKILNGENFYEQDVEAYKEKVRVQFMKGGSKKFIKILKDEFKNVKFGVKVNIAGKQKKLGVIVDKIVNIFRFIFANPQGFTQAMQIPGMAKSFNEILEFSGLSPADFSNIGKLAPITQSTASPELQ